MRFFLRADQVYIYLHSKVDLEIMTMLMTKIQNKKTKLMNEGEEEYFCIGNKTENDGDDVVPTGLQQTSSKKFAERISTSFSGLGQSKNTFLSSHSSCLDPAKSRLDYEAELWSRF